MILFRGLGDEQEENCKGIFLNELTKKSSLLVRDKGVKLIGPSRLVGMPFKIEVLSGYTDGEKNEEQIWECSQEDYLSPHEEIKEKVH